MSYLKQNMFNLAKQSVTPVQAASFYGLKANRNGMCCCPFHDDRTPSLKLYEDHFYCYGCGASGDVIDLVGKYLQLSPKQTAELLIKDFGIHLPRDQPEDQSGSGPRADDQTIRQDRECGDFRERVGHALKTLSAFQRLMSEEMTKHSPLEEWDDVFIFAASQYSRAKILLDLLLFGDPDEQEVALKAHGEELKIIALYVCQHDRRKESV